MLEVDNYSNEILHEISFILESSENLLILGENGAGKSTLAKVICNLISNEKIKINNKIVNSLNEQNRAELINYIPPKFSVFDEYITLKEFLELSFIKSINNNKIDKIIKLLKLTKLQNRPCIDLSSGEKQLLLLASSILHEAQITIFDELTANLDITRLKDVFDIFNSNFLNQKIIITHNLDLAYSLKYKVLFLKEGRIEFFGSNDEFFSSKNLEKIYGNSLKKIEKHLVVNLWKS